MESSEKRRIPIVKDAFIWPSDEPCFIASRCRKCGTVSFPKSPICRNPNCKNKLDVEETFLTRRGKLMTYTLVCYPPTPSFVSSQPFIPYAIGEVKFSEGIAIIGQIIGCRYEDLKIGKEVEMVVDKLFDDSEGNEVVGWKFRLV